MDKEIIKIIEAAITYSSAGPIDNESGMDLISVSYPTTNKKITINKLSHTFDMFKYNKALQSENVNTFYLTKDSYMDWTRYTHRIHCLSHKLNPSKGILKITKEQDIFKVVDLEYKNYEVACSSFRNLKKHLLSNLLSKNYITRESFKILWINILKELRRI